MYKNISTKESHTLPSIEGSIIKKNDKESYVRGEGLSIHITYLEMNQNYER